MEKRARTRRQQKVEFDVFGRRFPKERLLPVPHRRRPLLNGKQPVHVTLRVLPNVLYLRSAKCFAAIEACFEAASDHLGMRIVCFSVQGNHLHLIVEPESAEALSRAMQGLKIRLAKRLNRAMGRKGQVFAERYFAKPLRDERHAMNAFAYVLDNARIHAERRGERGPSNDRYAAGPHTALLPGRRRTVVLPRMRMSRDGWNRFLGRTNASGRPIEMAML